MDFFNGGNPDGLDPMAGGCFPHGTDEPLGGRPLNEHGAHDNVTFSGYEGNGVWRDENNHLRSGGPSGPDGNFDQLSW